MREGNVNQDAIDAAVSGVAAKVTVGSGAGSALAWFGGIDWLGALGMLIAAGSLLVQWVYKHRQDRRLRRRDAAERASQRAADELTKQKAADEHAEALARIEYWRSRPPIDGGGGHA